MVAVLPLWTHALAAMLFSALAIWAARRRSAGGLTRAPLALALGATALWSLSVAGIGAREPVTWLMEGVRTLSWLLAMALLQRRHGGGWSIGAALAYGAVALVTAGQVLLYLLAAGIADPARAEPVRQAGIAFQALATVAALVLVNASPALRAAPARLWLAGVATMWIVDLNLCTMRGLTGPLAPETHTVRGLAMLLAAGLFALALGRAPDRPIRLSRTATVRSISLAGLLAFLGLLVAASSLLARWGGQNAPLFQTALVIGSTTALLTLSSTGWLRAWVRVKLAKHLFRHRFDYRTEWTRFTDTLGQPEGAAPLDERLVKAIADLTDSPAGLLLAADDAGLAIAADWRWDAAVPASGDAPLAAHLAATGRIVELDPLREGEGDPADAAAVPPWMLALPDAWALVPLPHLGRLSGAILLARPPIPRSLDWEDFDLLRIAGRQVASYLAEARARDALAEAQRFEEFNRRFAFILHDIKNLVSQLSLVARNAERHADNPAFRADMVATLNEAAARMAGLVTRLPVQGPARPEPLEPVDLLDAARAVAARRRGQPIIVEGRPAPAEAVPQRLHQLLDHLVQNALEASAPAAPVRLRVEPVGEGAMAEVIDTGCGMSPAFVRDQLFRPFASSKAAGFGLGAFEARQIATGFGGRLEVESREGAGTCFRLLLRAPAPAPAAADASRLEKAA